MDDFQGLGDEIRKVLAAKRAIDPKAILTMGHQVIGYPSCGINEEVLSVFAENAMDLVELQIPFSDPVADGPLFVKANQGALDQGMTVKKAIEFIEAQIRVLPMPVLVMTYYNIIHAYGESAFLDHMKSIGVRGLIIPDAPFDVLDEFWRACKDRGLAMVPVSTIFTSDTRIREMADVGGGFIYHVPRAGVTGTRTRFDGDVLAGIKRVSELTPIPVGVGFGIQSASDVEALKGSADIAIMGSVFLKTYENTGLDGIRSFVEEICNVAMRKE